MLVLYELEMKEGERKLLYLMLVPTKEGKPAGAERSMLGFNNFKKEEIGKWK